MLLARYDDKFYFGDPNATCFEPFFPWVYKIMSVYPDIQDKTPKPEGLPSRSLPIVYLDHIN